MAIQDDFTIDYVNRRIIFDTAFVDDRPPSIYTVNELYDFLQDTFDEPAQMDDPIPMSAQTPVQYTLLYPWFIDNESMKALYGGSIQTSNWTKSGSAGITAMRWQDAPANVPDEGEVGATLTGGTSAATGIMLKVDAARQIVWVQNTSAAQFQDGENVTGTDTDFNVESNQGFLNGESTWSNLFSVGSLQAQTEIYIGQEDDQMGGAAFHDVDIDSRFERRIEKIDEWWDSDVDFATGSPNLLGGAGHFDVLVLTEENGTAIDGSQLAIFARQFSKIYSAFELVGGVGNFVVPFASVGADLNAADGPYNVGFDAGAGGKAQLDVGDILDNDTGTTPVGRLRAVVTAVVGTTSGDFDYYLIGENEPLATTNRTLRQFLDNENVGLRGDAFTFVVDAAGTPVTAIGPGTVQGITITFADTQVDVDEDATDEEYACTINCNSVALADVYKRLQFLTSRGNQDGSAGAFDAQDTLLPGGGVTAEASEFYRAVGDIVFSYDAGAGTQPTEGDLVVGSISGAYGVVTSITAGATGTCVLTQVKGTWVDNDIVQEIDAAGGNEVVVMGTPVPVVDNTGAPFGTFAGGRWFVARGVVLINVPAADANNWETVDLDGNSNAGVRRVPPAVRVLTLAGLVVNDRGVILEVNTAGTDDIRKNHGSVGAAGAALAATAIPLDAAPDNDVPLTGFMRIVDVSLAATGDEYRFEYSGFTGAQADLATGANFGGTTTSGGTPTVLNDTGAFTNFGGAGELKVGHHIRKTASGAHAIVVRKIDNDSIQTTVLTGAESWDNAIAWTANTVVVALVDADDVYFSFVDGVVNAGTSLAATVKFVATTNMIARARFSSPAIGGQRILPFELKNVTLTDADLTVTAIRTNDDIAP